MKIQRLIVLVGLHALVLSLVIAQSKTKPASLEVRPTSPEVKFEKFVLKNGLRVIVAENHASPIAAYAVYYNVGSRNEVPGRTGFAHLFEHMMFQGSENVGRNEHHLWIGRAGGNDNGSTSQDRTNYFATVPAGQIEIALWGEADRMRSLKITTENFENQHATVKEEKKQSYDNQPYSEGRARLYELLFEAFPYHHTVIGSMDDLNAAALKDVQEFFNTFYAPNNAVLAITGDIKSAQIKTLVEKYFATIPAQVPPPQVVINEPERKLEKRLELVDRYANIPAVFAGYNIPSRGNKDAYALEFLGDILFTGEGSRMNLKLVKETEAAVSVSGGANLMRGAGVFSLNLMVKPDRRPEEALALALGEIDKVKQIPVTDAELAKAKNRFKTNYLNSRERALGLAMQLCEFELFDGDAGLINTELDKYMAVSALDIQRVASTYLVERNRSVVTVLPANTKPADESFRKIPPFNETPAKYHFPQAKEQTFDNSLAVAVYEQPDLPKVTIQFYFRGGTFDETADKTGIATLLAAMLVEGSAKYPGVAFQEKLDRIGASFNAMAGPDGITVSVTTLKEYLDEVLDMVADVLRNPLFPDDALQKRKRNMGARLMQQRANPLYLASEMLYRQVFGDHPYARLTTPAGAPYVNMLQLLPTQASLAVIGQKELQAYHKQFFIPNGTLVVAAGDCKAEEIFRGLGQRFADWKKGTPMPVPTPQPPALPAKRTVYLIDRPGSVQSYILLGNRLFDRTDPGYFPFLVANKVLGGGRHIGGGGTGRLFMNLREEKGWTYGCYSWVIPFLHSGVFVINAEVRTEVTVPAVKEIFKEVERIRQGDVSADDLKYTKAFLGSVLPLTQEGAAGVAAAGAELRLTGLAADYWDAYADRVQAVTLDQLKAAAEEHMALKNAAVVIVGDAAKFENDLKPLCDELKVFDTKGQPAR